MNIEQYNPDIKLLLSGILTIEDVRRYSEYLRQIEMHLYNANIDLTAQIGMILPHDVKERFLNVLHGAGIDSNDSQAMQVFLADLKNKMNSLPVMVLTIAYEPTEQDLKNYSSFVYTNAGFQVVFDVRKDPSVIGGCKIEFNGKIADFTLKTKIASHGIHKPA